ncbi:glycoside hydrolase family 16 protein [Aeromicrobium sp.]|uniref:glycoside hydrolase family 16 protein n=1 Tax=Aeromicrobium sp. TaxID=1871063 RepID=UPI0030C2FC04
MHEHSGIRLGRRVTPPTVSVVVVAALAAGLVGAPAEAELPPPSIKVAIIGPETGTPRWSSSANATFRQTTVGDGIKVGELRPRSSIGRKTIRMGSPVSSASIAEAGSTIRVSARFSTSESRGKVALRVLEVSDGRVVSQGSTYFRPTTSSWRNSSVSHTTTMAGSQIKVYSHIEGVSRRHYLRIKDVAVTSTPPPPPPPPYTPVACEDIDYADPAQGKLTFADEFSGSTINRDAWRVRDDTFLNQDQAYITKENVSVHDGMLDIVGKRMQESEWQVNPNAIYERNKTRDYSTGYIDSIDDAGYGNAAGDRFGQKYGYFEVRAWVPSTSTMSRGIWPAFWLRADDRLGEIDPLESYGAPTIRNFDPSPSYEWNSWEDTSQQSSTEHTQGRAHPNLDNDPIWKGWHRYGVNWSPTCLRYTYDGETVGEVPLSSKPYFTGYSFDDTFHLRINLQVGTNYWGWADPAHTKPEFHYLVDYVRVYQGNGN